MGRCGSCFKPINVGDKCPKCGHKNEFTIGRYHCPDTQCPTCKKEMDVVSDSEGGSNHYWVLWCDSCHKRYQYSTYVLYGTLEGLTEWPVKL